MKYSDSTYRRLLSFPWLAWDVINVVRRENAVNKLDAKNRFTFDPLSDKITEHILEYISHRKKQFREFIQLIKHPERNGCMEDEYVAYHTIKRYCHRYHGIFWNT